MQRAIFRHHEALDRRATCKRLREAVAIVLHEDIDVFLAGELEGFQFPTAAFCTFATRSGACACRASWKAR